MIKNVPSPVIRLMDIPRLLDFAPYLGYQGIKEHAQFILAAVLHCDAFLKLTQPEACGAFKRLITDRPQYVSLMTVPYIDARWSCAVRVERLIEHACALQGQLCKYDFSVFQALHLLDLSDYAMPGYHVVIDKPLWFCHEGLITINLFNNNFRFFSITFSFYFENDSLCIVIGGVQGRKTSNILGEYRKFTKSANGLRPRDFLMEILRIIARVENVRRIVGVPDRFRYHRYGYFAYNNRPDLHLSYDDMWIDRGGLLANDEMYDIPVQPDRDLERVSANKRSMYRRRYALLEKLEACIPLMLQTAIPVASGPVD